MNKHNKGNFYWISDQIANRILARVLILQNRLYSGKDEDYEEKINNLSLGCLRCVDMNSSCREAARILTRQKLVNKATVKLMIYKLN